MTYSTSLPPWSICAEVSWLPIDRVPFSAEEFWEPSEIAYQGNRQPRDSWTAADDLRQKSAQCPRARIRRPERAPTTTLDPFEPLYFDARRSAIQNLFAPRPNIFLLCAFVPFVVEDLLTTKDTKEIEPLLLEVRAHHREIVLGKAAHDFPLEIVGARRRRAAIALRECGAALLNVFFQAVV